MGLGGAAAATEVKKEGKESPELEKYWQVVRTNPADFTGWTYLLQFVEQEVSFIGKKFQLHSVAQECSHHVSLEAVCFF